MNELNWKSPDQDLTYNQTLLYRATSKYGTYTLLTTLSDIRVTKYVDLTGSLTSWYKIRFYDSTNTVYSEYSQPMPASGVISDTNYTTPKIVAYHLNNFTSVLAESLGTGTGALKVFGPTAEKYPIADTETVYIAGVAKIRNVDYTMDYDNGTVTFATAPALSSAITIDYWANAYCNNSRVIDAIQRAEEDVNRKLRRTFYQPQQVTEYIDSYDPVDSTPFSFEARTYQDMAGDYRSSMNNQLYNRHLKLANYPVISVQQIIMNAQPTDVSGEAVGTGNGVVTAYALDNTPIVHDSEIIYVDGVSVTNYTIDYSTGAITFTGTPPTGAITADYTYCTSGTIPASTEYLVRKDSGMILIKQSSPQIKQFPFVCAVTYTHGYYQVPGLVEHLTTLTAMVEVMLSSLMGAPQAQDVSRNNINAINHEIELLYDSLGRTMDVTRI